MLTSPRLTSHEDIKVVLLSVKSTPVLQLRRKTSETFNNKGAPCRLKLLLAINASALICAVGKNYFDRRKEEEEKFERFVT